MPAHVPRDNAHGFAARACSRIWPGAARVIGIRIGVPRPLVLTIRVRIEKGAIAGLLDHRLRRQWRRAKHRHERRCTKKLEGRHCVSPLGIARKGQHRNQRVIPFCPEIRRKDVCTRSLCATAAREAIPRSTAHPRNPARDRIGQLQGKLGTIQVESVCQTPLPSCR
jgi:hypothetical protein